MVRYARGLDMLKVIDGLVQDCSISSALAVEILQSYTTIDICVMAWVKKYTVLYSLQDHINHFLRRNI